MNIKNRVLLIIVLVGLFQVSAYYISGATVRADGGFAIGQPDTLLYCQAARRIVEGHPFSYSEGVSMSTGTTSVLYPFVLAIPAALGADGDSLILAGFLLNAVFYLLFLFGWGVVIREKCEDGVPMLLGVLLVALSGQSAFCAMAASDTGMWMATSALIAAGLVTNKKCLYLPLLLLAPWIRPEGTMLAFSLALSSGIAVVIGKREARVALFASLIAFISLFGMFALNFWISGRFGFSSVANKGHFVFMPFSTGLALALADFARLLKTYFLGIPPAVITRNFLLMPLLGALFLWTGVFSRDWRRKGWWKEVGWLLAGLLSMLSVAYGDCEGQNMDRYLAWFIPTTFVFVADGVAWVGKRLCTPASRIAPALVLALYAMMSAVADIVLFHDASVHADAVRSFTADCEKALPKKAAVGTFGHCGIAYQLSPRMIRHLGGIYSPEFKIGKPPFILEMLKHEPDKRFDYWYLDAEGDNKFFTSFGKADFDSIGTSVLTGPQNHGLRKADWSIFDSAVAIPVPNGSGKKLVARVDVCYEPDEKAAFYEPLTIYDQPFPHPFTEIAAKDGGSKVIESGRLLLGGDEMTVPLVSGRDAEVVIRTLSKVHAAAYGVLGVSAGGDCSFKSPMELFVMVNGEPAGKVKFEIREDGFTDAHFTIPGSAIKQSPCRVGFHGEHVACCYWFYQ